MREEQLKTRIFLMLSVDWLLYLTAVGLGFYAVMYSENPGLMVMLAIGALMITSKVGDRIRDNAAKLTSQLKKIRQRKKF